MSAVIMPEFWEHRPLTAKRLCRKPRRILEFVRNARQSAPMRKRYLIQSNDQVGDVVQLVRTLPCHGRGRGFESRRPRHSFQAFATLASGESGDVKDGKR